MKATIWGRLLTLLERLHHDPTLIRGHGSGFEIEFARQLQRHGIFPSKRVGYERHPNGPHKWPDFHLYDERTLIPIELKTTGRKPVHMGQTWIVSEAIYVISHHSSKTRMDQTPQHSIFMAWGKDMKTEEDDHKYRDYRYAMKEFQNKYDQRIFSSSVEWSTQMELRYRLEERDHERLYRRVMEDLRRL